MPTSSATIGIPRNDLLGAVEEINLDEIQYIGQDIFTPVQVDGPSGNYGRLPRKALLTLENVDRAARGHYPRSDYKLDELTYLIAHYGHEGALDDIEVGALAQYFNLEESEFRRVWHIVKRRQEKRSADLLQNTTTFPLSGTTGLDTTNDWDSYSNATPIDDINAGITAIRGQTGLIADTLRINDKQWRDLSHCAQIIDKAKYTVPAVVDFRLNLAMLAGALGVKRVLVGTAMYDSADKGQAVSPTDIWSNLYANLMVTSNDPSPRTPCIGHTFWWKGAAGGGGNGKGGKGLMSSFQYREEAAESDIYRAAQSVQEKVTYSECNFLLKVDT